MITAVALLAGFAGGCDSGGDDDGADPGRAPPAAEPPAETTTTRAPPPDPEALRTLAIYGDSLTEQAWDRVERIAAERELGLVGAGVPGIALCDALGGINERLAAAPPDAVVVAFVGNNVTPCTAYADGAALGARYAEDLRALAAAAAAAGTPVYAVGPPAMADAVFATNAPHIEAAYRSVAASTEGVYFVDGSTDLSPDGFAARLPCLPEERLRRACEDGQIAVRDADGVHLARPDVTGYSGGDQRWASTLVRAPERTHASGAAGG